MTEAPELLAAAFREHEHLAPDVDATFAQIRAGAARNQRRRLFTVTASAAAVVTVLAAAPLALRPLMDRPAETAPASVVAGAVAPAVASDIVTGWMPPNTWRLDLVETRRVGVTIYGTAKPAQIVAVGRGKTEQEAYVLFYPGSTKKDLDIRKAPGALPAGEKVDVGANPGTYRTHTDGRVTYGHVTWEMSPGQWVGINVSTEAPGDPAAFRDIAVKIAQNVSLRDK